MPPARPGPSHGRHRRQVTGSLQVAAVPGTVSTAAEYSSAPHTAIDRSTCWPAFGDVYERLLYVIFQHELIACRGDGCYRDWTDIRLQFDRATTARRPTVNSNSVRLSLAQVGGFASAPGPMGLGGGPWPDQEK